MGELTATQERREDVLYSCVDGFEFLETLVDFNGQGFRSSVTDSKAARFHRHFHDRKTIVNCQGLRRFIGPIITVSPSTSTPSSPEV